MMPKVPTTPHSFDLTSLPVWETVEALRPVGQRLLLDLLREEKRPFLPPLLSDDLVELLAHGSNAKQTIKNHYIPLVDNIPLSSPKWQDELAKAIKSAIYEEKPQSRMPALMWSFIGKLSWEQLDIQLQTAGAVYQYLKPYYLFWPEFGDLPDIHANTYWLLITLASPDSSTNRSEQSAAMRIQAVAREQIKVAGGWAGFWDQWIAFQAWRKWPTAVNRNLDIHRAVNQLPLFLTLNATSNAAQTENIIQLARPDWENQTPKWFLPQYTNWQLAAKTHTRQEK